MDFTGIDPAVVLIQIVILLFSLSIHESAHAWTADFLGDPTSRYLGRVTLNPLVHIDPVGTILFPLVGLFTAGVIFGWAKPVGVNRRNLKNPKRDHLLIAAAGPAINVAAGMVFLAGVKLLRLLVPALITEEHVVIYPLYLMCQVGLFINVILAVFNLIPVPPLDGSWILSGLLPDSLSSLVEGVRPYSFILLILLLVSGAFDMILDPVMGLVMFLAF